MRWCCLTQIKIIQKEKTGVIMGKKRMLYLFPSEYLTFNGFNGNE